MTDQCSCMGGKDLQKRVEELEAALKPFAVAYEELLSDKPSPDIAISCWYMDIREHGDLAVLAKWSDLYRAANLLRKKG